MSFRLKCAICGEEFDHPYEFANNPWPLADRDRDGEACNVCNWAFVIPARLKLAEKLRSEES